MALTRRLLNLVTALVPFLALLLLSQAVFGESGGSSGGGSGGGSGGSSGGGSGGSSGGGSGLPAVDMSCSVVPDYSMDFVQYALSQSSPPQSFHDYLGRYTEFQVDGQATYPVTRDQNIVGIRVFCVNRGTSFLNDVDVKFILDSKFKACPESGNTSGLCVLAYQYGTADAKYFTLPGSGTVSGIGSTLSDTSHGVIFLRNGDQSTKTIETDDIRFEADPHGSSSRTFSLRQKIVVQNLGDASCSIAVSGAIDQVQNLRCASESSCNPTQVTRVKNGRLVFQAVVEGLPGNESYPDTVTWSGGPNIRGEWDNPIPKQEVVIRAKVVTKGQRTLHCAIKVLPEGKPYQLEIGRWGDCEFFEAARDYYFLNGCNKKTAPDAEACPEQDKKAHQGGVNEGKGLSFPNLDHAYATKGPDIPFRGMLNFASKNDGKPLQLAVGGIVGEPPLGARTFHGLTVTVTPYNMNAEKPMGNAILHAHVTNTNQLPKVDLVETGQAYKHLDPESYVVFSTFLPHSTIRVVNGLRMEDRGSGLPGSVPTWLFIPKMDYLVFMAESSCSDVFRLGLPLRDDKPLPSALSNPLLCAISRPYRLKDVLSGRARISLLHFAAENPVSEYPTDLLRTSKAPPCIASYPEDTVTCYSVPQTVQPPSGEIAMSHRDCWQLVTHEAGETYHDMYGVLHRATVKTTRSTFKPTCNVVEGSGCGARLAIRFTGYQQMMLAALGCVAKYDDNGTLSGVPVSATLKNAGIIPYTQFGGSAPMRYTQYPATKLAPNKGYGCIPCRFASDDANIKENTAPIPIDFDQPTNPRVPVYAFTRSVAPKECVFPKTDIQVRYFGSEACAGTKPDPGHFCRSDNVGKQNCPTSSENLGNDKGTFAGGALNGMVAGQFTVPLCPGGKLEFNSVSVSWSPLVLDLSGNGISISRRFEDAILFDIKGTGRRVMVDWPLNTDEVAFLVRPGKDGKVSSIKELFGDYKAKNGFEALRKVDSNRDGVIDARDKGVAGLRLWRDRNRNGISDADELTTLPEEGVEKIWLKYTKPLAKGIAGKTLSAIYFNGKARAFRNIEDHYFQEYWKDGKRISAAKTVK